ncbi:MAG: SDR family NAD(P)-dependent oxidoreductase, partial [Deltaproteobacteria bacterium]|nr:SDR family NAD(P)-dependent oxidoreductase [Deltaproteobacteria bacterium]
MDLQLKGKKVLITGGSKGIGRSCAEILASEGCLLHLAARGKGALLGAKEAIQSKFGVSMEVHAVDLSKGNEARALAEACPDIDIMVNNAGAIPSGDLWQVDEKKWREAWDLKVFGYINLCRAVFPQMQKRGKGVIINVIGGAGERPNRRYIAGGVGNAALIAFTKAMG